MRGLTVQDHATLLSEIDYLISRVRDIYSLMYHNYRAAETPVWQSGRVLRNLDVLRAEMVKRRAAEYPEVVETPSVAG